MRFPFLLFTVSVLGAVSTTNADEDATDTSHATGPIGDNIEFEDNEEIALLDLGVDDKYYGAGENRHGNLRSRRLSDFEIDVTPDACGPKALIEWRCRRNRRDTVSIVGMEWPNPNVAIYSFRHFTGKSGSRWKTCQRTVTLKCNILYNVVISRNWLSSVFGADDNQPFLTGSCPGTNGCAGAPPTPPPTPAPTPACMAGRTTFEKRDPLTSLTMPTQLQNLQVGDNIIGLNKDKSRADNCEVVSVSSKGNGVVYGNYTNDHYIVSLTTPDMVEMHGVLEEGVPGESLAVYQVLSSCPVVTDGDENQSTFSICGKVLYNNGPMPWTEYLKIHGTIFNLVKSTGVNSLSMLRSIVDATGYLSTLCTSGLACVDSGECDGFEANMVDFVNNELLSDAREMVFAAFPSFGEANLEGSLSFLVSEGKSNATGWYPDELRGTCRRDGKEPSWLKSTLRKTLDSCCERYFSWAIPTCKADGEDFQPSMKFYANYEDGTCLQDCEPGPVGCQLVPPPVILYDTLEDCCNVGHSWADPVYCQSRSSAIFSGGWVVDYANSKCSQDCDPAGGPPCLESEHTDISTTIFETPEECCEDRINWIRLELCAADSQNIKLYTDKFYVDYQEFKCLQDSDPANVNGGLSFPGNPPDPFVFLYDTAQECCEGTLGWIDANQCIADATGTTLTQDPNVEEWYVDWEIGRKIGKCVKSCEGGAPCGGLKASWEPPYSSASACCDYLSWVPSDECHL